MDESELEDLYGPAAAFSEHLKGERIKFTEVGKSYTGTIIWVCAPGVINGSQLPTRYIVEADQQNGFPLVVYPGEIVEQ